MNINMFIENIRNKKLDIKYAANLLSFFFKYIYIYIYIYLNDLERKLFNTTCIFIDDIHLFIYLFICFESHFIYINDF
jgi:hypothetical protein